MFQGGDLNHKIKECPLSDDEKPKEKREQSNKEFKRAMVAAVWGDSDSDEEQSDAQCHEAKLCLNPVQTSLKRAQCQDDSHLCLMAKSLSSLEEIEESEVSLLSLEPSIHLLSKNQLVTLLENVIDDRQDMNDNFSLMKKEIKNLTKQKNGL